MTTGYEEPNVIRDPISHEMAYPVGYELLRESFGDLPQWLRMRFHFHARPTTFAAEFTRILQNQEPYRILRVEHRPDLRRGYDHLLAGWSFEICPVPRAFKSFARAAICNGPTKALREFVASLPNRPHYYLRRDVNFDSVSCTCIIEPVFQR